mgnify:FL=1
MLEQKSPQKAWEGRPYHKKWGILENFIKAFTRYTASVIGKLYNILVITRNKILTQLLQEKEREVTKWNL